MFVCARVVFVVPEWHEATCNTNQATSLHVPSFVKQKNLIVILSTHSTLNFFRSYRETVVVRSHRSIFRFLFSKGTINAGHAAAHQFLNFFFFQLQTANVSRASFFFVLMLHISPLHTIHFSSKFICFITVYFSLSFFVFIFKKKCAVRFVWRFCCFSFISDRRFVVFFLRFSCGGKKWLVFQQACRSAA